MKKWEEQQRAKNHQKKIQGAKASLKNPNRALNDSRSPDGQKKFGTGNYSNPSASPHLSNTSDSFQKGNSDYTEFEKADPTQIPLYKLLKYYNLQQYAKGLISRDFGYDLSKLARLSSQETEFLMSDLKILPGHRVKFLALIRQIQQICVEIEKEAAAILKENYYDNKPKTATVKSTSGVPRNNSQKSIYSNKPKSQGGYPSTTTVNRMVTTKPQPTLSATQSKRSLPSSQTQLDSVRRQESQEELGQTQSKKIDAIGFDFFKDTESVDDEFAKALEGILQKYQKEVNDGTNVFNRTNSGFSTTFSNEKKQYLNTQEGDLLKRINYSEADSLKKDLTHAIDSMNSSRSDAETGIHDSDRKSDSSKAKNTSTTTTISSASKQGQPQYNEKPQNPEKVQAAIPKPIQDTQFKARMVKDDSTFQKKAEIQLLQEEKAASNQKAKLSEKQATVEPTAQVKRIDKMTSLDDNVGPKSNILNLVEKKINSKDLTTDTLKQELNKLKDLYTSFDGAKMTSTLINIDIEEMCFCFSCAIKKHVEYFLQNVCTPEYLDFVKKNVFAPKEEGFNMPEVRFAIGGPMTVDKRQALNEMTQNQLVDQVSKPGFSPVKRRPGVQQRVPDEGEEEVEDSHTPHVNKKMEESKYNYLQPENEESQTHDTNPMDYVENEEASPGKLREKGSNSQQNLDRYGNVDGDEEEDAEIEPIEHEEVEDDIEEEIYPEFYDKYRNKSLAIISERTVEHSDNNSQQFTKSGAGDAHEQKEDAPKGDEIDNFLRESLRDSVMLKLHGGEYPGIQQKSMDLAVHGHPIRGSNDYNQYTYGDEEGDEKFESRGEKMPSYVNGDEPEEEKSSGLGFSFVSQYTALDDLDSSQIDMNQRARTLFEKTFNDKRWNETDYFKRINATLDTGLISDYCKSIIITSKMEKEVVIVALIYIERLITSKNLYINPANWRNTVFTALVIASKIWDDESFENQNFAKAFPNFTTKEINQMERIFLEFIEYDIVIGQSEYAKYYFILRTFAEKNKKSFPLRALDVNTVITLQKNSKHAAQTLKAIYADSLNKTL